MNSKTEFPDRQAWLAARAQWIGASEVAIVVLPPELRPRWMKSPYALWAEKRGVPQPDNENAAMRWGLRLEQAIADQAVEQLRDNMPDLFAVEFPFTVWRHPDAPLAATPDRVLFDAPADPVVAGLLECKTARSAADWIDGPPLYYQVQVQAQLACTGLSHAWLAVLIGGSDFRLFSQQRNDLFIKRMLDAVRKFWERVDSGEPPDVDGHESTSRAISATHYLDNGETVQLPPTCIDYDERLQALRAEIAERQAEKEELENRIKTAIGDAKYGVLPHCRYSFSTVDAPEKTVVIPAKHYRVLRRAERRDT